MSGTIRKYNSGRAAAEIRSRSRDRVMLQVKHLKLSLEALKLEIAHFITEGQRVLDEQQPEVQDDLLREYWSKVKRMRHSLRSLEGSLSELEASFITKSDVAALLSVLDQEDGVGRDSVSRLASTLGEKPFKFETGVNIFANNPTIMRTHDGNLYINAYMLGLTEDKKAEIVFPFTYLQSKPLWDGNSFTGGGYKPAEAAETDEATHRILNRLASTLPPANEGVLRTEPPALPLAKREES